jgi:hypothetical protein
MFQKIPCNENASIEVPAGLSLNLNQMPFLMLGRIKAAVSLLRIVCMSFIYSCLSYDIAKPFELSHV